MKFKLTFVTGGSRIVEVDVLGAHAIVDFVWKAYSKTNLPLLGTAHEILCALFNGKIEVVEEN